MSSTLARRLRRIGRLPTIYTTTHEERLVRDEDGVETIKKLERKKPVVNREVLTMEELSVRVKQVRAEYRVRNAEFRRRRKAAQQ
jgi:hypothetical protein